MAVRYCGEVTLRIRLLEVDEYLVHISVRGKHITTMKIRPPEYRMTSLDAPAAFDAVARAAVSFATYDGVLADYHLSFSGTIQRRK